MKTALLFLMCSLSAMATNGGNLIGLSARSVSMGGTGVAHFQGVMESTLKNPALLTQHKGDGVFGAEFSNTLIGLNVKANAGAGEKTSAGKSRYIPDVAVNYKLKENMALGLGVLPYSGAKFDYVGETSMTGLKTDHTIVKIQPAFAFSPVENLNFGVSPIIGYGELQLNSSVSGTQSTNANSTGAGFAGQLGASYRWDMLTFGASYISPMKIKYKALTNLDFFGPNALVASTFGADDLDIQQPGEIAVGVAFDATPNLSFTFDYRHIGWSNADTYKELQWESQHVLAFGSQCKLDKLALRAGFNYAKSPLRDTAGEVGTNLITLQGHSLYQASVSKLDVIGFPPLATTHITAGAGYEFTDYLGADLAMLYAPKVTVTKAGTLGATPYTYSATMSQWAVTLGLRYAIN